MKRLPLLFSLLLTASPAWAGPYFGTSIDTSTYKAAQTVSGSLKVAVSTPTHSTYTIELVGSDGIQVGTGTLRSTWSTEGHITLPQISAPTCAAGRFYSASDGLKYCPDGVSFVYLTTSPVPGLSNFALLDSTQAFTGQNTFAYADIQTGLLGVGVIASSVTAAAIYTGSGLGAASVPDAALSANVSLLDANQTVSGIKTHTSSLTVNADFTVHGTTLVVRSGAVGIGYDIEAWGITGPNLYVGDAISCNRLFVAASAQSNIGPISIYPGTSHVYSSWDMETAGSMTSAVFIGSGAQLTDVPAGAIAAGSLGSSVIASSITLASMYGAPTLTGTNFTSLPGAQVGSGVPAANIAAGSLGASVIASSITLASMYGAPALVGTNFTSLPGAQVGSGVPAANIAAGSLGAGVIASSLAATIAIPFSQLDGYPAACGAGEYISALGDSPTCSAPAGSGDVVLAATQTFTGQNTFSPNGITASSITITAAQVGGIPATALNAGSMGASVIASSITLAAMYGAPTLVGSNFTNIPVGGMVWASSMAVLSGDYNSSGATDNPTCNIAGSTITLTTAASRLLITFQGGYQTIPPAGTQYIGVVMDGAWLSGTTGNYQWMGYMDLSRTIAVSPSINFYTTAAVSAGSHWFCLHNYAVVAAGILQCSVNSCRFSVREVP